MISKVYVGTLKEECQKSKDEGQLISLDPESILALIHAWENACEEIDGLATANAELHAMLCEGKK